MVQFLLITFAIFSLFSCSKQAQESTNSADFSYENSIERSGDENLPIHKYEYSENSNIILVSLRYGVSYKKFESLIQSKSGNIVSKNQKGDYSIKLSPELIEFITPPCRTYAQDESSADYFSISGYYSILNPKILYPTESCEDYYKRKNEQIRFGENSGSVSVSEFTQGIEEDTGLPLAVSVKSTEIYNGTKVAERQIIIISKDGVTFESMKKAIESNGWKLLANNFNLYQVDVSNQVEPLDEILKMADAIPEVEVASVNYVSSPIYPN